MNYELAKELKDAGFPQGDALGNRIQNNGNGKTIGYFVATIPTLEELIEACGEDFDALFSGWEDITKGYRDKDRSWRADATNRTGYSCAGSTPTEAVARLWLALNRK